MDTGPINPMTLALAASAASPAKSEISSQDRDVIQAVRAVNKAEIFGQNRELTFVLDRETKRPILKIVDRNTGETISQLPPEHVLRLARRLERP